MFLTIQFINNSRILQQNMEKDQQSSPNNHLTIHQLKTKYKKLTTPLLLTSSLKSHKSIFTIRKKQKMQLLLENKLNSYNEILKANKININFQYPGKYFQKVQSNIPSLKKYAALLMKDENSVIGKQNCAEELDSIEELNSPVRDESLRQLQNDNRNLKSSKSKIFKGRPKAIISIKSKIQKNNQSHILKNITNCGPSRHNIFLQELKPNKISINRPEKIYINQLMENTCSILNDSIKNKAFDNNFVIKKRKVSCSVMEQSQRNGDNLLQKWYKKMDPWNESKLIVNKSHGVRLNQKYTCLHTIQ